MDHKCILDFGRLLLDARHAMFQNVRNDRSNPTAFMRPEEMLL